MLAAARPSRAGSDSGRTETAAGIVRIGQCHRYSEYEIRPSHRNGEVARMREGAGTGRAPPPRPAAMTRPDPTAGSSAATPGYGVSLSRRNPAARIRPGPRTPPAVASQRGSLAAQTPAKAMKEP